MSRAYWFAAATALACAIPATAFANATIVILNNDAPGEGFNDATPATPVGGNPGVTVGEQRLFAFQHVAQRWGEILDSSVTITIRSNFDPLTCTATSAVLGSAGAISVWSNFANAPAQNIWFNAALANKIAGEDLDPAAPEISARFNSALNGNPACLNGGTWYYGFDHNEGPGQTDLLPVLVHEFGHGLGFQSFVSRTGTVGQYLAGLPDRFTTFLFDNMTLEFWTNMTEAERAVSMKNPLHVVWNGSNLLAASAGYLAPGTANLRVTSPPPIAGKYLVGEASFGPRLTSTPLTGSLLYAQDTTASTQGCSPYAAGTFTGVIAVIDRGTCAFTIKVKNAQDAGAIGVVAVDNVAATPPAGLGGADATITIPSVRVTLDTGNAIKAQLATGPVSISLGLDLTILAGADEANRVFLNTPDPIVPGSSVSHFDPSTSPNTLMEPAINADLTTNVDLALPLFRDLGWYPDVDRDLVADNEDNCIAVANRDQIDTDDDLVGDACDDDDDADGVADVTDNCRLVANTGQENTDADATGNACDDDDDNDTVLDAADNCPLVANLSQDDRNSDAVGDACDDEDGDGDVDAADNCPDLANGDQANADSDAQGDACDDDDDNDTVTDASDNCPLVANADQANADADQLGDACDGDTDGDGVANADDNCPMHDNATQTDLDHDGTGDACDNDDDNDGVADGTDNCANTANAGQSDIDMDGAGDACDDDDDNDAVADTADNCPANANPAQTNTDGDNRGDACDRDDDDDAIPDTADNCMLIVNADQRDTDGDSQGDACDTDDDNDGDPDIADNCMKIANADQLDSDSDGGGDVCDIDDDADGVLDIADNCALTANIGQLDTDGDSSGNACDDDDDNDVVLDAADNCPLAANADQSDLDLDGLGDACDDHDDTDVDDGGCCSTGKGNPTGSLVLGLAVLVLVRRRRLR
jgi:uncharacterized protein (TIGR03382 family)